MECGGICGVCEECERRSTKLANNLGVPLIMLIRTAEYKSTSTCMRDEV